MVGIRDFKSPPQTSDSVVIHESQIDNVIKLGIIINWALQDSCIDVKG